MANFPSTLEHGTGNRLSIDKTRRLLAVKESLDLKTINELLDGTGFMLEDGASSENTKSPAKSARVNHTEHRFWLRSASGRPVDDKTDALLKKQLGAAFDWIAPVYHSSDNQDRRGMLCPLPNVLLVKQRKTAPKGTRGIAASVKENTIVRGSRPNLHEVKEKSRYLNGFHYFEIASPEQSSAYEIRAELADQAGKLGMDIRYENMPLLVPAALVPNDPMFAQQWSMTQIQAPGGWDISTGVASVVVCILDEGCDLTHPDLQYASTGINLGSMAGDGSPTGPHGTACAGVAAATFNNGTGVTGVAGGCEILPAAFQNWTDVEVAAGITYATDNGAQVISMSFGWDAWDASIIDPAIQYAFDQDVVMCVATHNYDSTITYPATNPLVMACGASDQIDDRKSPASPDGETWGSNFGAAMSVVAPGVMIATTDQQGANGYNVDGSGGNAGGVFYPSFGDAAGHYFSVFNGTSAATPHVAGLAGLIRSAYPGLSNVDVRNIIEQTADKAGTVAYADTAGYDNGTWNQETGYGRINVSRALDFSDLMIRDWTGDTGVEPSSPSGNNFWSYSDIVVRISDDNVFVPGDPAQSKHLEIGQTNYLYIRVKNNGPRVARNVVVDARLTAYVGTQFVYPHDWTVSDATHLSPTPVTASFASIPAGGEEIAKFTISAAQVDILANENWHPCMVASVSADNDFAFDTASFSGSPVVVHRNNLAQRNLSLIDVLANATAAFPFVAGHVLNTERTMELVVDRSQLPKSASLRLAVDRGSRYFPGVDFTPTVNDKNGKDKPAWEFIEETRIKTRVGCCDGVLTLAKGSRFDCGPQGGVGEISVKGGEVVLHEGERFVDIRDGKAVIRMETSPNQVYPLVLEATMPASAKSGARYQLDVAQRNSRREVVGGASMIFAVK